MEFNLKTYNKLILMFNGLEEDKNMALEVLKSIYGRNEDGNLNYGDDSIIAHQLILKGIKNTWGYKSKCILPYQFKVSSMPNIQDLILDIKSEHKEGYKKIYSYMLEKQVIDAFSKYKDLELNPKFIWR